MAQSLYELDVRLLEIEPPIWRTIELAGSSTLEDVHFAIQVAMGWTLSHLHQFKIGDTAYGMAGDDMELEDERQFRLQDVAKKGDSFSYEYDFGDGWEHAITVTKVAAVSKAPRPRWTAGARACPPEDCGGPGGYANLVQVLADPEHPDHAELVEWSDGFQPEELAIITDLEPGMAELAQYSEDEVLDEDALALPDALVEAVLALEPMQRASLAALIAGSLANQLLEAEGIAARLAATIKTQAKPARGGRKRTRT
jgi:hypothetical protein